MIIPNLKKGFLFFIIGIFTYPIINIINSLTIKGMNHLKRLPKNNVLFVSNHQTYFLDVITFNHIFCAAAWGKRKRLGIPYYLLWPFTRINYVAASTTMKSTLLSRIFTLAGAITVKRTWSDSSTEKISGLDIGDTRNISRALENNWVITFPQGTTTPFAQGRKGTAFIIKQNKPIVIPIVIKGFSEAFGKKNFKLLKWRSPLQVTFKAPLSINYDLSTEAILQQIMDAIEQSPSFNLENNSITQQG